VASAGIAVGGGYEVCRGVKLGRVLLDGAGDRLLERGVRFQVDEKEADVCFKLLPEGCDGVFVVRQFRFEVSEEAGVLSDEVRQSLDLLQNALCAHKWGRWCPEWQVQKISLTDASTRANAAVVLLVV
jgi:hypothetical protein